MSNKDQEKVAEVTRVRVELQEQNGRLQAELTAQEALKEKVAALERQLKGELSPKPPMLSLQGLFSWDHPAGGWAEELSLACLSSERHWHGQLGVSASRGPRASLAWPLCGPLQWPVPSAQGSILSRLPPLQ